MNLPIDRGRPGRRIAAVALGAVASLVLAAAIAACGRKALPRPPQWVLPEIPAPLEVSAVDGGTKLSWRRPTKYVDGSTLDDLGRFDVERSCFGLPWEKVAELEVSDRERFRRNRAFAWVDRAPAVEPPCHYRVTAWTMDGYGSAPAEGWLGAPSPTPKPSPSPAGGSSAPSSAASPAASIPPPAPLASPTPDVPPPPVR